MSKISVKLVEKIRQSYASKSTEELLQIWKENDRERRSESAFEATRQLLKERGVELPPQEPPKPPKATIVPQKSKRRKIARTVTAIVILLWGIEISLYASELVFVRREPVTSLLGFSPLIAPVVAMFGTCLWYVQLGKRELRGPFALTIGTICAVLFFGGVGYVVSQVITEGVTDLWYFIGGLTPIVVLHILARGLSFERKKGTGE